MIAQGLGNGIAAQDQLLLQADIGRRGAYLEGIGAGLDVPLTNITLMAVEA